MAKGFNIQSDEQYTKAKGLLSDSKFQQQHPAEWKELYSVAKQYSGQKEMSEFAARLDTTPVEYKAVEEHKTTSYWGGVERTTNAREVGLAKAAAQGVDVNSSMPWKSRTIAGLLAYSPKAQKSYFEYTAQKAWDDAGVKVPDGVPLLARDPATEDLAYLAPYKDEKGNVRTRWTLINGAGLDAGDLARATTEIASAIPEIGIEVAAGAAGAVAGSAVGPAGAAAGGVAGMATGAAGGSVLANTARRKLAQLVGVPDEILAEAGTREMVDEAAIAAGASIALPVLSGAKKMWKNQGKIFDANVADNVLADAKDQMAELAEAKAVLEKTTGQKFNLTAAEQTGDPEIAVVEAATQRRVIGKASKELSVNEIKKNRASVRAVKAINNNVAPYNPDAMPVDKAAEAAQSKVREGVEEVGRRGVDAERSFDQSMKAVDDIYDDAIYKSAQKDMDLAAEAAEELNTKSWEAFRKANEVGMVPGNSKAANVHLSNPDDGPIKQVLDGFDEDSTLALSQSDQTAQEGFLKDLGHDVDKVGDNADGLWFGLRSETLDMRQLHKLVSHLKKQQRDIANNVNTLGWKGEDINTLVDAIETQIDSGTFRRLSSGRQVNPALATNIRNSYGAAKDATTRLHDVHKNRAVKELLHKNSAGEYITPPSVMRQTFLKPNDERSLVAAMRAVGNDPTVRADLAEELIGMYKTNVAAGGASPEKHNAFMNAYKGHMDKLFGEADSAKVLSFGDMIGETKRLKARADKVKKATEAAYGKRLSQEQAYAGNVARDFLTDEVPVKNISNLKRRLGGESNEWKSIQRAGLDDLDAKFLSKGQSQAGSDPIHKVVSEHGSRLDALYGPQYRKNLTAMRDVLRVMEGTHSAKGIRREVQPGWLQITRTFFGPLSKAQRRFSAANNFFRRRGDRIMAELLSDPDKLDKYVKIASMREAERGGDYSERALLALLGAGAGKWYHTMMSIDANQTPATIDPNMAELMYNELEGKGEAPAERRQSLDQPDPARGMVHDDYAGALAKRQYGNGSVQPGQTVAVERP